LESEPGPNRSEPAGAAIRGDAPGVGGVEGEAVGAAEREPEQSAPTPVDQAAGERSAIGLDQPLPAGVRSASSQIEARGFRA
jgi:hypothetical protein